MYKSQVDYTYDDGGNRLTKVNNVLNNTTTYTYDYSDPGTYGSNNNRLMMSETKQFFTLLSTTWYYYNVAGNVTRVVTRKGSGGGGGQQSASSSSSTTLEGASIEGGGVQPLGPGGGPGGGGGYCMFYGGDHYTATRFEYASNGRAVTATAGEQWCLVDEGLSTEHFEKYNLTFAREFRYDGSRQRYLDRELDPHWLKFGDYIVLSDTWSDYDGDSVYGDYTVSGGVATNARSYEPGVGKVDPWNATGSGATDYYHTDGLGTTRMMTDDLGAQIDNVVYTAFGEQISGASRRYGYVGAWGYQSHAEMQFQHIGACYYDPSSGRFLQRDPIGIIESCMIKATS